MKFAMLSLGPTLRFGIKCAGGGGEPKIIGPRNWVHLPLTAASLLPYLLWTGMLFKEYITVQLDAGSVRACFSVRRSYLRQRSRLRAGESFCA
jgi:hypothetical protein